MSRKASIIYVKRRQSLSSKLLEIYDQYNFLSRKRTKISEQARKKIEIENIAQQRREDSTKVYKANRLTLENILMQSGLKMTKDIFIGFSIAVGVISALFAIIFLGSSPLFALLLGAISATIIPRWYILRARKKRFKAFANAFPVALDSMVRNVKAGISVGEALKILAAEAKEPLRNEFVMVVQEMQMGLSMGHVFERMAIRIPLEETRFLAIAIEIQTKSGGNLSEVLGNLSKVLRERQKLQVKIKSMTAESKAGAAIIGGIPIFILMMLYFLQPEHVMFFFEDPVGKIAIIGSGLWQGIGFLLMRKMTRFEV